MQAEPILAVHDLSVRFRAAQSSGGHPLPWAVDQVSFTLSAGQTLAIVGESGSGKSVSCLAMMGLIPQPPGEIVSGEIWFRDRDSGEGVDLLRLSDAQLRRYRGDQIAMIFQEPMSALNPVQPCGTQIIEAIRSHEATSRTAARRRAIALLREVQLLPSDDELAERYRQNWTATRPSDRAPSTQDLHRAIARHKLALLRRYPHELSGGQLQRVMIAMALACNPTLLIADEPTTALDVTVQATILRQLRDLRNRRGMAMIFVSHDLGVVAEVADTVAVMYQGQVVEYGPVQSIFLRPKHPYTKGLLACRPRLDQSLSRLPTVADFMTESISSAGERVIVEKAVAWETFGQAPATPTVVDRSRPLLQVEGLQVHFPVRDALGRAVSLVKAVDDISFEVFAGETLGLVGESGCGKSTLARTLLRLIQPTGGRVLLDGQDMAGLSANRLRRLRRDLQIIFQDPNSALNPRLKVGAAIAEPMRIHGLKRDRQGHRAAIVQLLERVGLEASAMERYPHEFSGGQRQRICIARALALSPRFIICDESVSALDVSVQAQVLNLLKALQAELGLTYLFISHDLSVVKFMSDRMIVMNQGRIEEMGSAAEIYANPQRDYTQRLIAAIPQVETFLESA